MSRWRRSYSGSVARPCSSKALLTFCPEPAALGEALGDVLRKEGIELVLDAKATSARRDADDFVLEFEDGGYARGDRLLVATGRRPRVHDLGLESVGIEPDPRGVPVDDEG